VAAFDLELRRVHWRASQRGSTLLRIARTARFDEDRVGPENVHLGVPLPWPGLALGPTCPTCGRPTVTDYGRRWLAHVDPDDEDREVRQAICVCVCTL
jgi:hypothetical protein